MTGILNRHGKDRGFTLLEIMISLGLIAVALLAVSKLQTSNLDQQIEAGFMTNAALLAENRLVLIESRDAMTAEESSGDFGDSFPQYTYEEDIQEVPDSEGLFKVSVKIIHEQGEGKSREFLLETLVYRRKS